MTQGPAHDVANGSARLARSEPGLPAVLVNRRFAREPRRAQDAGPAVLQSLAYELTVAEARERERIARDLHDEIGQLLAIAHLKLGQIRLGREPALGALLDELGQLLGEASRATRAVTYDLCCPILSLGLGAALESLARRHAQPGLEMRLDGAVPALNLAEPVQAVIFRVVRELTLNVCKHAQASHAWIRCSDEDSTLRFAVVDDGVGFDPAAAGRGFSRDGGFGLISVQAQMQAIGGWLEIGPAPGLATGTRACAALPIKP